MNEIWNLKLFGLLSEASIVENKEVQGKKKLDEIGADLKSLINTKEVFDEDEKLLDNQDLAFLLKVSKRTLQRYRSSGKLPFFMIGHKTYYRTNDVREFVR